MAATPDTLALLYLAENHGMRRIGAGALDLAPTACGRHDAMLAVVLPMNQGAT
jgi:fructose-1,6-bisphosphatase/inositol monophosphatase family enzyme